MLLEHGADVNQQTEGGWTALLAAVQNRNYKLASFLLEHGADPKIQNKGGWSPLYIATDNRNIEGGDYPTRKPDMDHLDDHQAVDRSRRGREHAHALEHRDAHDLHAPMALRRRRDAVPARRAVERHRRS